MDTLSYSIEQGEFVEIEIFAAQECSFHHIENIAEMCWYTLWYKKLWKITMFNG